jgi:hypothetical protein
LKAIVKRRGGLNVGWAPTVTDVLKLSYQSMVERPISGRGGIKVVERPARVHGKGKRFAQISDVRQNVSIEIK